MGSSPWGWLLAATLLAVSLHHAASQLSILSADLFDLADFTMCGVRELQGVEGVVADFTYRPNQNTLRTVVEGSPVVYEHDLKGKLLREVPFDDLQGKEYLGIAPWRTDKLSVIDSSGAVLGARLFDDLTSFGADELELTLQTPTGGAGSSQALAYSRDCSCFIFYHANDTYSGPMTIAEFDSAVAVPEAWGDSGAALANVTSLHVSDLNKTLFFLDSTAGAIYKMGFEWEGFAPGASLEFVVNLVDLFSGKLPDPTPFDVDRTPIPFPLAEGAGAGRRRTSRRALRQEAQLDYDPVGLSLKPDGSLMVLAARDGRIVYYCADPLETRSTGGEFEFDNRNDGEDFDYYDEPYIPADADPPGLNIPGLEDRALPGFEPDPPMPPPTPDLAPDYGLEILAQLIGVQPSFFVVQEDGETNRETDEETGGEAGGEAAGVPSGEFTVLLDGEEPEDNNSAPAFVEDPAAGVFDNLGR